MARGVLFTSDLLLALLALFLPPVPVWIKCGFWSWQLLLDVFLVLFGGIPAAIYAWYIIIKYPDDGIPFFDVRRGTYEIIPDVENQDDYDNGAGSSQQQSYPQSQSQPQSQQSYHPSQYPQDKKQKQAQSQDSQPQAGEGSGPAPFNGWNRPGDYSDHPDEAGAGASGSRPPPYEPGANAPTGADNKVQYHDDSFNR
ncbi:hypothetical protein AWJ20_4214 [Sugiyamaella lignohabitans]|uniref:Uncharacterized protein n=1 Tax=Sugiyamaella lignohabitans TaxID=796027 RepID=A0A167C9R3_9ASCO|nr:uncharacterized protein AWJ20_4214 [Sugiyamaella lignohabitans]ANB11405.1 hypothetical protein AWJ20_4214 [Sugiyamaella lignohabitans]